MTTTIEFLLQLNMQLMLFRFKILQFIRDFLYGLIHVISENESFSDNLDCV